MDKISGKLNISVKSSGFEVEPDSAILVENDKLPLEIKWTVSPKGEGDHIILLHISEVLGYGMRYGEWRSAKINGKSVEPLASGDYELPIKVYTYWGVPRIFASCVAGVFTLIGFMLSWPIVLGFLERRRKSTSNAGKISVSQKSRTMRQVDNKKTLPRLPKEAAAPRKDDYDGKSNQRKK
ncbi:MAG: hypothetical protein KF712_10495 [Akkermansiaceae bacterium]|nr:hypothetical protein [Akkermansiaceae bacterium]